MKKKWLPLLLAAMAAPCLSAQSNLSVRPDVSTAGISLLTETIRLSPVVKILHLKGRSKFDAKVYQYQYDVPDHPEQNFGSFEVHGKNHADADKIIIGCRRFNADGNGKKPESPDSVCGKIYISALALFVDKPAHLLLMLMNTAKQKGHEFSSSRAQIDDVIFEYANDGALFIRRASRTEPSFKVRR
jgi:hypothetical protein